MAASFSGGGAVKVIGADGSNEEELVTGKDVVEPDTIEVDVAGGKIYWTNMGPGGSADKSIAVDDGSIMRADLDVQNVEAIVPVGVTTRPKQLALDSILFSGDLELPYDKLVRYYSLRFQIEFNFRDAKQFWGLEEFMNTSEKGVANAANLSLFMVSVSHRLLQDVQRNWHECSILDLKAWFRAYVYVKEVLKLLPEKLDPILTGPILSQVANLGAIHPINVSNSVF